MSRDITARIVLIKLVYAVVYHGVADRKEYAPVLAQLEHAIDLELAGVNRFQRDTIARHVVRAVDTIMAPHIQAGESCAKFGLVVFYAICDLIDQGAFVLDNQPFSDAMDAVLHEDGTVTEFANMPLVDRSAQKQSRRLLVALQSLGYFETARTAA
jgi:hypothetical protein